MFRSLTARLFAILAAGLLLIQGVSVAAFLVFRGQETRQQMGQFVVADAAMAVDWLSRLPPDQRSVWVSRLNRGYFEYVLLSLDSAEADRFAPTCGGASAERVMTRLRAALPDTVAPVCREIAPHTMQVRMTLDTRQALALTLSDPFAAPPPAVLLLYLALVLLAVAPFVAWAVRQTTRRVDSLLSAIERFGGDFSAPPVPEGGPPELQRAAQAFNGLRERILRHLDERTQILAAVAHDLQTPLTRLRLRTEAVTDGGVRERLIADVDLMTSLVSEGIAYARSAHINEAHTPIEVNQWLEGLADDMSDLGCPCRIEGRAQSPYAGAPRALTRVMQNLIGNAAKYGGGADIHIDDAPERLTLRVRDRGPGIPESLLDKVFEPFFRVEGSRNRETGGSGLGLAIARNLVRAHGGDIFLRNLPGGGLEARVDLPRHGKVPT